MLSRSFAVLATTLAILGFTLTSSLPAKAADDAFADYIKNKGDWIFKVRATSNHATESETVRPTTIGGEFQVDHEFGTDMSLTYFLEDRLAIEFSAGYTENEIKMTETTLGNIALGEYTTVPIMAFLQYHFDPILEINMNPYVGAGYGYWFFFDANDGAGVNFLDLDSTYAFGAEVGADIPITDRWAINVNARKYWVDTEVITSGPASNSDFNVDPWVIGIGFDYKFRQKTFDDYHPDR